MLSKTRVRMNVKSATIADVRNVLVVDSIGTAADVLRPNKEK